MPGVLANPNLPSNNEYKGGFGSGTWHPVIITEHIQIHIYFESKDLLIYLFIIASSYVCICVYIILEIGK